MEDSKTQAYQLLYLLENSGYTASTVHSAEDAIDFIRKTPPSLVITDIVMPGMSGFELCLAIKADSSAAGIPVILLTSLDSPQDIISALESGADDFISKPYDDDILILKLEKYYEKPPVESGHKCIEETEEIEEVEYLGKQYRLSVSRQKMLDLMISAYEAAIQKNIQLIESQETLVYTNRQLAVTITDKEEALESLKLKEDILKRWNSELNIMNILGAVINQSATLDELLQSVAEEVLNYKFAGASFGIEFLISVDDGKNLSVYTYLMKKAEIYLSGFIMHSPESKDELNQGQLLKIIPACDMKSCYWNNQPDHSSHGHISILLVARERTIGLMKFTTEEKYNPEEHVAEMLVSLGKQLGMAIENHNLLTETKRLSLHDPLTGLPNRRMIDITLDSQIARVNRYGTLFSLIIMDIDHFKQYNDNFGHDEGDRVLIALSSYLKENIRDTDLAARFGGEEFIIIISELGLEDTYKIAERHLDLIHQHIGITVSMGIAEYKKNSSSVDLIKSADEALYCAKEKGRNRIEMYIES